MVAVATVAGLVLGGGCAGAETAHPAGTAAAHTAGTRCVRARIGSRVQCLAPGDPCQRRYEHAYNQHDFTCKRGRDGHYRLRERIFSAPVAY